MATHLRIARPVSDLARSVDMYCRGLGYVVLGSFEDHGGFDGVMVGAPGGGYHFEFTHCRAHPVKPAPTFEDLVVLYVPETDAWEAACLRIVAAGFRAVASFNPYWDRRGRTFEDDDGYRVVLQRADWTSVG
jgi:catechol 2,3-dioxygenase-like lactoylglutathione lyase family enzyme